MSRWTSHCPRRAEPRAGSVTPPARVLRRQRRLPLPRAGVRRAPLRARRAARRRLAPDRQRSRDVRALAAAVARVRAADGADRGGLVVALGVRLRRDERLLLRRDRRAPARDRRGDRVPPRHPARGGRRPDGRNALALGAGRRAASTCSPTCELDRRAGRRRLRVRERRALRHLHRARPPSLSACAAFGSLDGLAAAMSSPRVVVTPLGGWSAVPALLDPVAIAGGHRRRHHLVGRSRTSSTSSRWRGCAGRRTRSWSRSSPRRRRSSASSCCVRCRRRSSSPAWRSSSLDGASTANAQKAQRSGGSERAQGAEVPSRP